MNWPDDFINKIICGDCLDVMKEMPDKCIDVVISDPPYGIEYESNHYKDKNPHGKIIGDSEYPKIINELWRLLTTNGAIFLFCSQKNILLDERIKNYIVWVKNNWPAGDLRGDFGNQYELIAFLPNEGFIIKGKRYSNVWFFDRIIPKFHPTEKPLDLITRIVNVSTQEDSIVLDPFLGSGTTAEACKLTHRNFIGIEINPDYCKISEERLAQGVL